MLLSLDPPAWHLRHSHAVAEIAAWIALRVVRRGIPVDRGLVESAALLHDVDKVLPATDPSRALGHGDSSAAWLWERGLGELAEAVAAHPVTRLASDDVDRWLGSASVEARIVAYADKRAGQRLEPMADRFAGWAVEYPNSWPRPIADRTRRLAEQLEAEVCALAGIAPADVRRLRWVDLALTRAALAPGSRS